MGEGRDSKGNHFSRLQVQPERGSWVRNISGAKMTALFPESWRLSCLYWITSECISLDSNSFLFFFKQKSEGVFSGRGGLWNKKKMQPRSMTISYPTQKLTAREQLEDIMSRRDHAVRTEMHHLPSFTFLPCPTDRRTFKSKPPLWYQQ